MQALDISFVETRLRHPLDGLLGIVADKSDPHHGVSAVADDDLADLVQVRRFVGGAHHGLTARAERLEGPVEAVKFRLPFLALRDVRLQPCVRGFEFVGPGANQLFQVVAVARQFRFGPAALGDVARGGKHALHGARLVSVDHRVIEHVDRAAGEVADRERVVPHETRAQDQLIPGVRPFPFDKIVGKVRADQSSGRDSGGGFRGRVCVSDLALGADRHKRVQRVIEERLEQTRLLPSRGGATGRRLVRILGRGAQRGFRLLAHGG